MNKTNDKRSEINEIERLNKFNSFVSTVSTGCLGIHVFIVLQLLSIGKSDLDLLLTLCLGNAMIEIPVLSLVIAIIGTSGLAPVKINSLTLFKHYKYFFIYGFFMTQISILLIFEHFYRGAGITFEMFSALASWTFYWLTFRKIRPFSLNKH